MSRVRDFAMLMPELCLSLLEATWNAFALDEVHGNHKLIFDGFAATG